MVAWIRPRCTFLQYRQSPFCTIQTFQAAELGYEVAASNAAFLLDRGKIRVVGGKLRGANKRDTLDLFFLSESWESTLWPRTRKATGIIM